MGEVTDRQRAMLRANLVRQGWSQDDAGLHLQGLTIVLGSGGWEMSKGAEKLGSGTYGQTQMSDVKKTAAKQGVVFAGQPRAPKGEGAETKKNVRMKKK